MDFGGDDRGVSELIGAVFLFAFLIIGLSGYQVWVVPSQNAEVEWNHNLEVQDDMVDVRNTVLASKISGDEGYAAVQLGSEYPSRVIAVNPPNPTGTLRSTEPKPISVTSGGDDITDVVCGAEDLEGNYYIENETRFLEYEGQYNELDNHGVIRYENSILYHDYEDADVVRSSQRLLQDDEISIVPLVESYSEQGRERVVVEPRPGLISTERVSGPTVTLPTELDEDKWQTLLEPELEKRNELDDATIDEVVNVSNGNLTLSLERTYQIECAAIGVNEAPASGDRDAYPDPEEDVHPAEVAGVRYDRSTSYQNIQKVVGIVFENVADEDINISRVGINFYQGEDRNETTFAPNTDFEEEESTTVLVGDPAKELDKQFLLEGESETEIYIRFEDGGGISQGEWFILTVQFGTGERTQYFVNAKP